MSIWITHGHSKVPIGNSGGSSSRKPASSSGGSGGGSAELPKIPAAEIPATQTTADTLRAILKYAPQLAKQDFELQSKYEPLRANLASQLGAMRPAQYWQEILTSGKFLPEFQKIEEMQRMRDRLSNFSDVAKIAPTLEKSRIAAELPQTGQIRDQLMNSVLSQLRAGTKLDPTEGRVVDQQFRASEEARGLSGGYGSAAREGVKRAMAGQALQQQRLSNAQSVLGQEYQNAPNPFALTFAAPLNASQQATAKYAAGLGQPTLAGNFVNGQQASGTYVPQAAQIQNQSASNNLAAQQYNNSLSFLPYLYSKLAA